MPWCPSRNLTKTTFSTCVKRTASSPPLLGHVTKGKLVVDDKHFGFCEELRAYYDNALEEILTED